MHIARWCHQSLISLSGGAHAAFFARLLWQWAIWPRVICYSRKNELTSWIAAKQHEWDVCPTWETSFLFSRGRGDIEIYDVFDAAAAMFASLLFRAHKFITGKRKKRRFVPLQLPPRCRGGRVKCKSDAGRTLLCATFPKWPVKVVLWCFQPSEPHSVWLIIAGDRISRSFARSLADKPTICMHIEPSWLFSCRSAPVYGFF
jgi:hypothetical protein